MFDFMAMFASHLTRDVVQAAYDCPSREALDALFADVELPER
jgi:LysR family cys regulon transcriptional activator